MSKAPLPKIMLDLPSEEEFPEILTMDWLIKDWIEREDIVIWAGDPGIGKSLVLLSGALSLASGQPLFGLWPHPTGEPLRVAILDFENRPQILLRRLIRLCGGLGIPLQSVYGKTLHVFYLRGRTVFGQLKDGEVNPVREVIEEDFAQFKPDLIVLDTIMSATDQDDLGPLSGVRFIREALMRWAKDLHSGFWCVQHVRKPWKGSNRPAGERIGDLNEVSGGGFVGMSDALVLLQEDEKGRVVVTNPKQRHTRQRDRLYLTFDPPNSGPMDPLRMLLALEQGETNQTKNVTWLGVKVLFETKGRNISGFPSALLTADVVKHLKTKPIGYKDALAYEIVQGMIQDGLLIDQGPLQTGAPGRPPRILTVAPLNQGN